VSWTIRSVLSWSGQYLQTKGIDSPRLDSEILLSHSLGLRRIDLYLDIDRPLTQEELSSFRTLLKRRSIFEPIAYILNEKEFFGRSFHVNPDVLIPRPETEILVEQAVSMAPQGSTIAEIGVGSGAVIISILCEREDLTGYGNDISCRAVLTARNNARMHNIDKRLHLFAGRSVEAFSAEFSLIVVNPPYIALRDKDMLGADVIDYEPLDALFGGNDGLDVIKEIFMDVRACMVSRGRLIMEVGYDQKASIQEIVNEQDDLDIVEWVKDLSGKDRAVIVEKTVG